jgi:hypothetical protein
VAGIPDHLDLGTAGASARRQAERRKGRSGVSWDIGATGEEMLGARLATLCPEVPVLHDRQMPDSSANIDHIAVAASGVFVIDAKRYKGKIEVRKPWFKDDVLVIRGSKKTKLVEGLRGQVAAVRARLAIIEQDVPVHGCFCFLTPDGQAGGTDIPTFRTLKVDGIPLFYPRKLAKRLRRPGPLGDEQVAVLTEALVELFPKAR